MFNLRRISRERFRRVHNVIVSTVLCRCMPHAYTIMQLTSKWYITASGRAINSRGTSLQAEFFTR